MMIFALDPTRARTTTAAALLGGLAAGALAPMVLGTAGPELTGASVAFVVAGTALLALRSSKVVTRSLVAGALGLLAAATDRWIHGGPSVALLGLGVGLVLAPEGLMGGVIASLGRASAASLGALVGAVLVGLLGHMEPFASLAATQWGALLGGAIGLGAGLGEALRASLVMAPETIAEVEAARGQLTPENRSIVDSARQSHGRIVEAVRRSHDMSVHDKLEALSTAKELATATARQALSSDELARTVRSVPADAPGTHGPRERIETTLGRRRDEARARASDSAAALAELAMALTERAAPAGPALAEEDLAARARGLATRLNGREPATTKG